MMSPDIIIFSIGAGIGVVFTILCLAVEVIPELKKLDKELKVLELENTRLKETISQMGWF